MRAWSDKGFGWRPSVTGLAIFAGAGRHIDLADGEVAELADAHDLGSCLL